MTIMSLFLFLKLEVVLYLNLDFYLELELSKFVDRSFLPLAQSEILDILKVN